MKLITGLLIYVLATVEPAFRMFFDNVMVFTRQHYDYDMSKRFIEELGLPNPHIEFRLENSSPTAQIGEIMIKVEKALESLKRKPIVTLVQGDTNSVLATALASLRLGMRVGHVEA
ncbi:MAG: UDP-N-acetylglucosamine 2-epimerase, partial [Thermosphaera sp.]